MKRILLYFIYFFVISVIQAQDSSISQTQIEIEGIEDNSFDIQPVGKNGIIIFKKDALIKGKNERQWTFIHLDKNFHRQVEVHNSVADYLDLNGYYYDSLSIHPKLYLLFSKFNKTPKELLIYDIHAHKLERKIFETPKEYLIGNFKVYRNVLYVIAIKSAFCFNINTEEFIPINLEKDDLYFEDLFIDKKEASTDVIVRSKTKSRKIDLLKIYEFSEGKYKKTSEVLYNTSIQLGDSHFHITDDLTKQSKLLYGIFNLETKFFFGKRTNPNEVNFRIYDFQDFKNLNTSLLEKRKSILKQKHTKIYGNFKMVLRDLIRTGNQYICIGEIYFPTYKYQNGSDLTHNKVLTVTPAPNGALYTHVFVAGLDSQGNLLWNDYFEIGQTKSSSLDGTGCIYIDEENTGHIKSVFIHQNKPYTKIIQASGVLNNESNIVVEETQIDFDDALIKQDTSYWYDNYFIQYNYKRTSNKERTESGITKYVFNLSKISF